MNLARRIATTALYAAARGLQRIAFRIGGYSAELEDDAPAPPQSPITDETLELVVPQGTARTRAHPADVPAPPLEGSVQERVAAARRRAN